MKTESEQAANTNDIDFVGHASSAILEATPRGGRVILWAVSVFLLAAFTWAAFAELDEVTRGTGKVIPSSQLQVVQNLEGGILSEILVKEGDIVDAGQVLVRIDDTLSGSSFRESRLHYLALKARASRLKAEADNAPCDPPHEVMEAAPTLVEQEFKLRQARQNELDASLAVVKHQIEQRKHDLAELRSKNRHLIRNYQLSMKEMRMTRPLVDEGAVSEMEVLRLEQKINDVKSEIDSTIVLIARAEHIYEEALSKAEEIEFAFRNEARAELAQVNEELSRLGEANFALQDRVQRTQVRAPMRGTVQRIMVTTIGGIIQPGMDILEIVPLEDSLQVEVQVRPADIAFLYPGQKARVKITAYDFAIYGGLDGVIENISADTILDEQGNSYYKVRVRTQSTFLGSAEASLPIIPGMTAQVDIMTGKKSVLDYLLNPVLRAKEQALRER